MKQDEQRMADAVPTPGSLRLLTRGSIIRLFPRVAYHEKELINSIMNDELAFVVAITITEDTKFGPLWAWIVSQSGMGWVRCSRLLAIEPRREESQLRR